jgi:predicted SnoaL-like aldol condensation-catalyzing enzyme
MEVRESGGHLYNGEATYEGRAILTMKSNLLGGALGLLAMVCTPLAAQTPMKTSMTKQEQANVKLALDWWREGFVAGHAEVVDKYLSADMIQHNPNMSNGNTAIKGFLSRRTPINPIPEKLTPEQMPVFALAQGDLVTLIFDHEAKDPADPSKTYHYNSFDLFRVKDGKFVEHWDDGVKTARNPNAKKKE